MFGKSGFSKARIELACSCRGIAVRTTGAVAAAGWPATVAAVQLGLLLHILLRATDDVQLTIT